MQRTSKTNKTTTRKVHNKITTKTIKLLPSMGQTTSNKTKGTKKTE